MGDSMKYTAKRSCAAGAGLCYNSFKPGNPAGLDKGNIMTNNQNLAHYVLGYVPAGYVCIIEWSHGKGLILQDGEPVASFRITQEIMAGKY